MQALILAVVLFCATVLFFTWHNRRLAEKGTDKRKSKLVEQWLISSLSRKRGVQPETINRDSPITFEELHMGCIEASFLFQDPLFITDVAQLATVGQFVDEICKQLNRSVRD